MSVARHTDYNSVFSTALPGTLTDARGFLDIDTLFATLSDESKEQATDQRIDARVDARASSAFSIEKTVDIVSIQGDPHVTGRQTS